MYSEHWKLANIYKDAKMLRICKVCNQEKELSDFAKNGKYYKYMCKQCASNSILAKIKLT